MRQAWWIENGTKKQKQELLDQIDATKAIFFNFYFDVFKLGCSNDDDDDDDDEMFLWYDWPTKGA